MEPGETVAITYETQPAAPDAWRVYEPDDPKPGYFQFDWISARHPDLYHRFALSTDGLMDELPKLVDLSGLEVIDIGAGTGRSTIAAARTAKHVYAVDAYKCVVEFGISRVKEAGLANVTYLRGDSAALPLKDESVDVAMCSWAQLDPQETLRVLRPGGLVVWLGCAPWSLMGELTEVLASAYSSFVTEVAAPEKFDPACPSEDGELDAAPWPGLPVRWMKFHDFTHIADFGDREELAAIVGRIYGPVAETFCSGEQESTLAYRLRIYYGQVAK
jgi:SAM-dependent methyltransferase